MRPRKLPVGESIVPKGGCRLWEKDDAAQGPSRSARIRCASLTASGAHREGKQELRPITRPVKRITSCAAAEDSGTANFVRMDVTGPW